MHASLQAGETPLHLAAKFGRLDFAVLLLQKGADPHAATLVTRKLAEPQLVWLQALGSVRKKCGHIW